MVSPPFIKRPVWPVGHHVWRAVLLPHCMLPYHINKTSPTLPTRPRRAYFGPPILVTDTSGSAASYITAGRRAVQHRYDKCTTKERFHETYDGMS